MSGENGDIFQLSIKKAYNSAEDNIVDDFLIPCLERAIEYRRVAGYFSSSTLALAARGVTGLVKNGGVMKLVTSVAFQKEDHDTVQKIIDDEDELSKYLVDELGDIEKLESDFRKDHYYALAWMLANKKLEIRIAIPLTKKGIFHPKIGIITYENGNSLSFSGSVNESANAWKDNIEEFKVFKNWNSDIENEFYEIDEDNFFKTWDPSRAKILGIKTISLPHAVQAKIIQDAPKDFPILTSDGEDLTLTRNPSKSIRLFDNQIMAREKWFENGKKGIFSMATGTGKTITALSCVEKMLKKESEPILIVITCPFSHLLDQWNNEIARYGLYFDEIIKADKDGDWKDCVTDLIIDLGLKYKKNGLILVTNSTFSGNSFIDIIRNNKKNISILLISDEVHGLGAKKMRRGLIDSYDFRIGLSATPQRYFDDEGSDLVQKYFGGIIFDFDIFSALTSINPATQETYLTPYDYYPIFVNLTNEELENYKKLTRKIIKNRKTNETENDQLQLLLFARADIVKNAEEKLAALVEVLKNIHDLEYTLIYCNPGQIDKVIEILNQQKIITHRFTGQEGTSPKKEFGGFSERGYILDNFKIGSYKILVSMKCLDEGVDVPAARRAIIMASSGNPREHIQRIGRVIRRFPDKQSAEIIDMVVVASTANFDDDQKILENQIMDREIRRCEEIALNARNSSQALQKIYSVKNKILE